LKILITGNFINSEDYAPFQRVKNISERLSSNFSNENEIAYEPLTDLLVRIKITLLYPIFFIVTSVRVYKRVKLLFDSKKYDLVYFYGRNLSFLLPFYLCCKLNRCKLMVDHVENPVHLYSWSGLFSNLRLDQLLGYPFLWFLSDVNLLISRSFENSILFRKSNSVYVPILISIDNEPIIADNRSNEDFTFVIISTLGRRDKTDSLMDFISLFENNQVVKFVVMGRFEKNEYFLELNNKDNVTLYDNVDQKLKLRLMNDCDAFIMFRNFRKAEQYSSPTRLAEFLKYQKPIVVNESDFVIRLLGVNYEGFYEWDQEHSNNFIIKLIRRIKHFDLSDYNKELNNSFSEVIKLLKS